MRNKAVWLALAVLALATMLMVFFVMPNINAVKPSETSSAALPLAQTTATQPQPTAPSTGDAPAAPAQTATPQQPETAAKPETDNKPGFDIVRVEPDGSAVIAGHGTPLSRMDIMQGDRVVATAEIGAGGDFAAVLDQPLAPGDYQLSLRETSKSGEATRSQEVATVSVPDKGKGDLLAMVSKPGEASRVVTAPAAQDVSSQPQQPLPQPAPTSEATAPSPVENEAPVRVTAVEIEGSKIFIAGQATPGSVVRIYADKKLVGETKVGPEGRFVVDGEQVLSVGNHVIRADVMSKDGSRAEFRASVPFNRPEGEQMAVVAQPELGVAQPDAKDRASAPPMQLVAGGSFDRLRNEAAKAFGLLKALFANGKMPDAEALAAARSANEIALGSLASMRLPDDADPPAKAIIARTAQGAQKALILLKGLPADAASVAAALPRIEDAIALALNPRSEDTTLEATQTAPANATPAPTEANTGVATVVQAPLKQSDSSVIIRKGDTLWQISRRVYGAGVRYTTIYLANENLISDPDRILPGQVFGVPTDALPDAEKRHRERMKHSRS